MISSPRILRPFTATLIHKIDDESFITVEMKYVAFDESYGRVIGLLITFY